MTQDDIRANGRRGSLVVRRRGRGRLAMLLRPDGITYVVPVLDKARLLEINERGLLLTGYERIPPRGNKGAGWTYPQTWWCEVPAVVDLSEGTPPQGAEKTAARRDAQDLRDAYEIGRVMTQDCRRPGF